MVHQIKEKPIRSNICREKESLQAWRGCWRDTKYLTSSRENLAASNSIFRPTLNHVYTFSPFSLSSLSQARKDEQLQKRRNLQVEPDETPLQESNKTIPLDLSLPAIVTVSPPPTPPPPPPTHTHTTQWSLWYSLVSLVQYISRQAGKW